MKFTALLPLAACGLILTACGSETSGTETGSEPAAAPEAAAEASGEAGEAAATPASLSAEEADQAFRCNALFVAAVTGRITGQRALPTDLDAQVRPMGQAWWQEREEAAIAALSLSADEATARAAAEGERVNGRRELSEEDITDLRACVAAMG